MIHAILTGDHLLKETLIESFSLHAHPTDENVWQKNELILIFSDKPQEKIEQAILSYNPEKIWSVSPGYAISTEHRLGDIVLPNVFLPYDEKVWETEFTRDNRDDFLKNALFLSHYETQSDVDFEHFGLSIGGINVSVPNYNENLREPIEFAYSADSVDSDSFYASVMAMKKLERDEDFHPVVALVGLESDEAEKKRVYHHLAEVLRYLQSSDEAENLETEEDIESFVNEDEDERN